MPCVLEHEKSKCFKKENKEINLPLLKIQGNLKLYMK